MTQGRRTKCILALAGGLIFGSGSLSARPALTGTGGGPETTITAPHTAPTGQTVPRGLIDGPAVDPETRTERQRNLDRVLDRVCTGCR
jgi:hypothetical protein